MECVKPITNAKALKAMREGLWGKSAKAAMLLTIGVSTGMRISDLLGLRVRDLMGQRLVYKPRKTTNTSGRQVEIPITKEIKGALKRYREAKPFLTENSYLFYSQRGRGGANTRSPLTRTAAYFLLRRHAADYNLSGIGCHTLRKTFGYMAVKNGLPIHFVTEVLGHTTEAMTRRYCGLSQEDTDAYFKKFTAAVL